MSIESREKDRLCMDALLNDVVWIIGDYYPYHT
jgi:hypothetical protein